MKLLVLEQARVIILIEMFGHMIEQEDENLEKGLSTGFFRC